MTLEDAYKATGTGNRFQLAKFLTENGYPTSSAAIYKWKGVIPESGMVTILKAVGAYPNLTDLLKDHVGD